jgi:ComF family protein
MPKSEVVATVGQRGPPGLLRRNLTRGFSAAADFILPPMCVTCREPLSAHDSLCSQCWREIEFIRPPICDRLGLPMPFDTGEAMVSAAAVAEPPPYDRARAVAAYTGVMRTLVHDLKFRDRHDARQLFGRWLVEAGEAILSDAEVVVPVPLGRWRLLSRRFNQAAILAHEVARVKGLEYAPLALVRQRATMSQVGLSRRQRQRNVAGAFAVVPRRKASLDGRKVVLVDDVITTGATVAACARTLKRAGASRVDVLALALVTDWALTPS